MKRIGVIVPIYNTAKYLHQCIDSILLQLYGNLSIILIDDGSDDGSSEICDTYARKDSRIQVIHQKNLGKLVARYRGVQAVDCDYVSFVDSDDWIAPNSYEKFAQQMELGIDVISWQIIRYFDFGLQKISEHFFPLGFYDDERFHREIYPSMIWRFDKNAFGIDPSLCNKLIKKELVLRALESAQSLNVGYGDDVAVIYPLLREIHTLFLSKENLYYHRKRSPMERAPYLLDKDFYKKLYFLYEYLRNCFAEDITFIEQLDAFYSASVLLHLNPARNSRASSGKYIFPFDKIPFGKSIILYGASRVGQDFYKQISCLGYAKKILWVDKNYEFYKDLGVKSIKELEGASGYDYLVIAIQDEMVASEVRAYLSKRLSDIHIHIIWSVKDLLSV